MLNETVFTDGVLVEQTVDNGDGTGTRTTYDADGNVTSTEQLTGLPIPVPPEPTAEERSRDAHRGADRRPVVGRDP
jgi:YD repeat-containing protein